VTQTYLSPQATNVVFTSREASVAERLRSSPVGGNVMPGNFSNPVCGPRPHSDTRPVWRNLFNRTGEDRTEHRKKEHIGG